MLTWRSAVAPGQVLETATLQRTLLPTARREFSLGGPAAANLAQLSGPAAATRYQRC